MAKRARREALGHYTEPHIDAPGGPASTEIQPAAMLENQIGKEIRHGPSFLTPRESTDSS